MFLELSSIRKYTYRPTGICNKDELLSAGEIWEDSTGMSGIWEEPRRAGSRQVQMVVGREQYFKQREKKRESIYMWGVTGKGKGGRDYYGGSEFKLKSHYDERNLLANNTSPRFTMTRFNLQWTSYCFPHFWLALFNIKNRYVDKWHLYASFFPQLHVIHGSLIWLSITTPEKFCWPKKQNQNQKMPEGIERQWVKSWHTNVSGKSDFSFFAELRMEPRALHILGKGSTTKQHPRKKKAHKTQQGYQPGMYEDWALTLALRKWLHILFLPYFPEAVLKL